VLHHQAKTKRFSSGYYLRFGLRPVLRSTFMRGLEGKVLRPRPPLPAPFVRGRMPTCLNSQVGSSGQSRFLKKISMQQCRKNTHKTGPPLPTKHLIFIFIAEPWTSFWELFVMSFHGDQARVGALPKCTLSRLNTAPSLSSWSATLRNQPGWTFPVPRTCWNPGAETIQNVLCKI